MGYICCSECSCGKQMACVSSSFDPVEGGQTIGGGAFGGAAAGAGICAPFAPEFMPLCSLVGGVIGAAGGAGGYAYKIRGHYWCEESSDSDFPSTAADVLWCASKGC